MRIGVIGLQHGHHAHLLQGAVELGGCEIVAVSDADENAVRTFIRKEPLARKANPYVDWRHLLEHSLLDLCYVSDENGLRAEQLLPLLERNVHIIAEKPLATTWEDFVRVRTAMAASQSRLTMMLTMRHDPKYTTMRRLVREGAVGRVRQVTSQKSYRLGQRPAWQKYRARVGGIVPFIGIHPLDLMSWVAGKKYTRVAAFHAAHAVPAMNEMEDSASLLLEMEDGATATCRLDYLRPETAPTHGDDRLRIAGTEGVLEATSEQADLFHLSRDRPPRRIRPEPTDNLFLNFIASIREGKPARIPDADCLYITEVVLKARQAADGRKMIELSGDK